ncbi:MAG: acyltransferase [Rhizobium sp.]|nr:MAG: acyltransferase [Rhizobium sp.]
MGQNAEAGKESGRFSYIDSLRGIAALLVVFEHYFVPLLGGTAGHFIWYYVFEPGKIGVIWFFIISGFVIPFSLKDRPGALRDFAISRFFRLYPTYWLSIAMLLLAAYLAGVAWPSKRQILANLTMFQTALGVADISSVYWTLFIELVFYIVCAVAFRLGLLKQLGFKFSMLVGMMLVAMVLGGARGLHDVKYPLALPLGLSVMFFGAIWREALIEGSAAARKIIPACLLVYCVTMPVTFYLGYNSDMGYAETWTRYVCSYAFAISTFLLLTGKFHITNRFWVWTGSISYAVYLFHSLVKGTIGYLTYGKGFGGFEISFASLVAMLLVSHLVHVLFEQRFINLGHSLRRRFSARPAVPLKA